METSNPYVPGEITVRLASEDIERGESPILNAVLSGIFSGETVSERFNACLVIELNAKENPHAERPLLVHPGFPEFCRNLFERFPHLIFAVDEGDEFEVNDFLKSAIIAAFCSVTAAEKSGKGFVGINYRDFKKAAALQLRAYSEAVAKCPDRTNFADGRLDDLELYLSAE